MRDPDPVARLDALHEAAALAVARVQNHAAWLFVRAIQDNDDDAARRASEVLTHWQIDPASILRSIEVD